MPTTTSLRLRLGATVVFPLAVLLVLVGGCGGGGGSGGSGGSGESPTPEVEGLVLDGVTLSGSAAGLPGSSVTVEVDGEPATIEDGTWRATIPVDDTTGELPASVEVVMLGDGTPVRRITYDLSTVENTAPVE